MLWPCYQYAKDRKGLVNLSNSWAHPPFTHYPPPSSAPDFADVIRPVTVVKEISDFKKITDMRRLDEATTRAILLHGRTVAVVDGIDGPSLLLKRVEMIDALPKQNADALATWQRNNPEGLPVKLRKPKKRTSSTSEPKSTPAKPAKKLKVLLPARVPNGANDTKEDDQLNNDASTSGPIGIGASIKVKARGKQIQPVLPQVSAFSSGYTPSNRWLGLTVLLLGRRPSVSRFHLAPLCP